MGCVTAKSPGVQTQRVPWPCHPHLVRTPEVSPRCCFPRGSLLSHVHICMEVAKVSPVGGAGSPPQLRPATAWPTSRPPQGGTHRAGRPGSPGRPGGDLPYALRPGPFGGSEVEAGPLPQGLACGPLSDRDSPRCLLTVKGGDREDASPGRLDRGGRPPVLICHPHATSPWLPVSGYSGER